MNVTFAVVGSPGYIKSHGLPATPQGLLDHACVRYRFPSGVLFPWEFEKAGHEVAIDVSGPISLDDQDLMVEAALAGAGLAYVFHESVADLIAEGRLIRCLDDWCPTLSSIYLYYTNRSHQSASLKALIALLQKTPPKA